MIDATIGGGGMPAYHEDMLIVKTRPSAAAAFTLGIAATVADIPFSTPGMAALATYERAGLIKRVTPLASKPRVPRAPLALFGTMSTMFRAPTEAASVDANSGVSIVEVEAGVDLQRLALSLASDHNFEFAARVPIRYLVAAKAPANAPGGAAMGPTAAPPPASTMWNLRKIQWAEARAFPGFREASEIKVAVLDTGVDFGHPDLGGRVAHYVYDHPSDRRLSSDKDLVGHGTHVAGTIAALINNDIGINGITPCKLHVWKIFDDVADYNYNPSNPQFVYFVEPVMYRRALAECLEQGVDVINLSIGGSGLPDPQEASLFSALVAGGTTVVAAMGNERQYGSPISYPAAIPGVIAIGATGINDVFTYFSNQGGHISLCAPGDGIWSTYPTYPGQRGFAAIAGPDGRLVRGWPLTRDTDYASLAGTSMASPHVAGAAALLLANKGKMSGSDARQQLMAAADKVSGMGGADFDADYGAGRLNLPRLLQ